MRNVAIRRSGFGLIRAPKRPKLLREIVRVLRGRHLERPVVPLVLYGRVAYQATVCACRRERAHPMRGEKPLYPLA